MSRGLSVESGGKWERGNRERGRHIGVDGSGINGRGIRGWCVMGDRGKFGMWGRGGGISELGGSRARGKL